MLPGQPQKPSHTIQEANAAVLTIVNTTVEANAVISRSRQAGVVQQCRNGGDASLQECIKTAKARLTAPTLADTKADEVCEESEAHYGSSEANASWRTMVTLNMIVTIVGDYYGQRDLLASRLPWAVSYSA